MPCTYRKYKYNLAIGHSKMFKITYPGPLSRDLKKQEIKMYSIITPSVSCRAHKSVNKKKPNWQWITTIIGIQKMVPNMTQFCWTVEHCITQSQPQMVTDGSLYTSFLPLCLLPFCPSSWILTTSCNRLCDKSPREYCPGIHCGQASVDHYSHLHSWKGLSDSQKTYIR